MRNFFILVLSFHCACLLAQHAPPQIESQISIAVPINEFAEADSSGQVFFGIGAGGSGALIKNSPIRIGFNARYFWIGSRSKTVSLTDDNGIPFQLKSKVSGSMTPIHVLVRVDAAYYYDFPILPYFGGFAGIRLFGTNNKLSIDYEDGTEPSEEHDRKVSTTSSFGFEAGIHIRITDQILVDARYERAYGGWAKYLDVGSVKIDDEGNVSYNRLETRTDVQIFSVGVTIYLD